VVVGRDGGGRHGGVHRMLRKCAERAYSF
jgi:hypothetical protein